MTGTSIRVVLADDHPFVRRGLRETLDEAPGIAVIAEAADGLEALTALRAAAAAGRPANVLVTDLTMPSVDGLELLSRLRAEQPSVAVLMLSVHPESEVGLTALKAGAAGYLEKRMAPETVVAAVLRVASGRRYMSDALAQRLMDRFVGRGAVALSMRELQVVRGIALGQSRETIADALALSPATISTYKRRASAKLGTTTDADLTRAAMRRGLVEASD